MERQHLVQHVASWSSLLARSAKAAADTSSGTSPSNGSQCGRFVLAGDKYNRLRKVQESFIDLAHGLFYLIIIYLDILKKNVPKSKDRIIDISTVAHYRYLKLTL